jgi:hypothetical protein
MRAVRPGWRVDPVVLRWCSDVADRTSTNGTNSVQRAATPVGPPRSVECTARTRAYKEPSQRTEGLRYSTYE